MVSVKRSGVRKSWIGLAGRARIRTRRGDRYLVLGKLVEINEKGIKIAAGSRSGGTEDLQEASRYPWECVVGLKPLEP